MSKSDSACCTSGAIEMIPDVDKEKMTENVFSAFVKATK